MRGIRELKEAFARDDNSHLGDSLEQVELALHQFLRRQFRAEYADAQDAVQQTIVAFYQSVKRGLLHSDERLGAYVSTICKREYMRTVARDYIIRDLAEMDVEYGRDATQAARLEDREKRDRLRQCLSKLNEEQVAFIVQWFTDPDVARLADTLGVTKSSISTRKHRILRILMTCVNQ
jgi:RNA polymerase sigma factor (sigma-70 family)